MRLRVFASIVRILNLQQITDNRQPSYQPPLLPPPLNPPPPKPPPKPPPPNPPPEEPPPNPPPPLLPRLLKMMTSIKLGPLPELPELPPFFLLLDMIRRIMTAMMIKGKMGNLSFLLLLRSPLYLPLKTSIIAVVPLSKPL